MNTDIFRHEIEALAKLCHLAICHVDVSLRDEHCTRRALVIEYCPNFSLVDDVVVKANALNDPSSLYRGPGSA